MKVLPLSILAAAALALCTSLASAAPADGVLTADNEFWLYTGNASGSQLQFVGEGHAWSSAYAFVFDVAPGDYLYVLAHDWGPPKSWIGAFNTPLGVLNSNATDWVGAAVATGTHSLTQSVVAGASASWAAPKVSTYGWGNPINRPAAQWIWMVDQSSGPQTALFRSALPVAAAVPEPGSWALLAGGLGSLALLARRRQRPVAA